MTLRALLPVVATEPSLAEALSHLRRADSATLDLTAPAALRPFIASALALGDAGRAPSTVLVVTATGREAEEFVEAARCLLDERLRRRLPGLGDPSARAPVAPLGHGRPAGSPCSAGWSTPRPASGHGPLRIDRRAGALGAAAAGQGPRRPASRSRSRDGDDLDLDDVVRRLAAAAYHRVDLVERRGEFAVRGGIVDVFPPTAEHPLRVEFWGDTVEEIRHFAVADQRSLDGIADGPVGTRRAGSCC